MTRLGVTVLLLLGALLHLQAQPADFQVLYSFAAGDADAGTNIDGSLPLGLVLSGSTIYGAAERSGTGGSGALFSLNTNGSGFSNFYIFAALQPGTTYANSDGANPQALLASGNVLYGTATAGGDSGFGSIFSINPDGSGFANLYNFTNGSDGALPNPGLILLGGRLFGTAEQGGSSSNGTVFAIGTNGQGFTTLYSFTNGDDGAYPYAGLVLAGSTLFGTTSGGGISGNGGVFAIQTNGAALTNLYSFSDVDPNTGFNSDGANPEAGLILSGSTLYGTTSDGGSGGSGTVFALNTNGSGFAALYDFTATTNGTNSDGSSPEAALILSSNTLYGTASYGGSLGGGTVFSVETNGSDFAVLHAFTGGSDGANPNAALILSGSSLYGTATEGGSGNSGTVFSLSIGPFFAPQITTNPASQLVEAGSNVTLVSAATGTSPLTYRWLFDGVKISGATNSVLTLKSVATNKSGNYEVIVTNFYGMATSAVANVTVLAPALITTAPANQTQPVGGIASYSASATGSSLTYHWMFDGSPLSDGGNIFGSATNKLVINPVNATNAGSYTVVISNILSAVTSKPVALTLSIEKSKPSVAIKFPTANSRTNAPVLSGTAADTVRVMGVEYWVTNLNKGLVSTPLNGWTVLTNGTTTSSNWTIPTATLALLPGTNILAVQSFNAANLASPIETTTFFYKVPALFTLATNGHGSITGVSSFKGDPAPTNQAELNVGEGYTLTAKPANNCWLTNWTANNAIAGTNTTLTFIMESNLSVTANFTSNLFVGMAARYDGIFYPASPTPATTTNSGLVYNLVVASNGLYSGKLYLASATPYSFSGTFDNSGFATKTIDRTAAQGGDVTLQLNILWQSYPTPRQITGLVSNAGWTAEANLCAATTNLLNYSNYTALLPPNAIVTNAPPGYGYALITNLAGKIHFGGALADGTSFSDASLLEPINELDQFPVYASLYNNTGLLLGELSMDDSTNAAVPAGNLIWFKPRQKTGLYTNGFDTGFSVAGSPWTNSVAALAAFTEETQLICAGGGLVSNLTNTVQLTASNTLKLISGTNLASGSISRANGLMTVTFTNSVKQKFTAYGTVLQNLGVGGGYFAGTNSAGTLRLGSPDLLNQIVEDQFASFILIEHILGGGGPPLPPAVQEAATNLSGTGPPTPQ